MTIWLKELGFEAKKADAWHKLEQKKPLVLVISESTIFIITILVCFLLIYAGASQRENTFQKYCHYWKGDLHHYKRKKISLFDLRNLPYYITAFISSINLGIQEVWALYLQSVKVTQNWLDPWKKILRDTIKNPNLPKLGGRKL